MDAVVFQSDIELTNAQQDTLARLINEELRPEEERTEYKVRAARSQGSREWPEGTVSFTDGEERRWYIRPDGTYTWRT